jgi:hypothetical protein
MIEISNVGSGVANVCSGNMERRDPLDDLAAYVQHDIKMYHADEMSTKRFFAANFRLITEHDYLQRPLDRI